MHRRKQRRIKQNHKEQMTNAYRNLSAYNELNNQLRHRRTLRYIGDNMFRVIDDYRRITTSGYYEDEKLHIHDEYFHA